MFLDVRLPPMELIGRGESPMAVKRVAKERAASGQDVEQFAAHWLEEVVTKVVKDPRTIRRVLDKDVFPAIGRKPLPQVTPSDVLAITDPPSVA